MVCINQSCSQTTTGHGVFHDDYQSRIKEVNGSTACMYHAQYVCGYTELALVKNMGSNLVLVLFRRCTPSFRNLMALDQDNVVQPRYKKLVSITNTIYETKPSCCHQIEHVSVCLFWMQDVDHLVYSSESTTKLSIEKNHDREDNWTSSLCVIQHLNNRCSDFNVLKV